jgi:hypothetical protein
VIEPLSSRLRMILWEPVSCSSNSRLFPAITADKFDSAHDPEMGLFTDEIGSDSETGMFRGRILNFGAALCASCVPDRRWPLLREKLHSDLRPISRSLINFRIARNPSRMHPAPFHRVQSRVSVRLLESTGSVPPAHFQPINVATRIR